MSYGYCIYSVCTDGQSVCHLPGRPPTDVSADHRADQTAHRRRRLGAGPADSVDPPAGRRSRGQRHHRQTRLSRARARRRHRHPARQRVDGGGPTLALAPDFTNRTWRNISNRPSGSRWLARASSEEISNRGSARPAIRRHRRQEGTNVTDMAVHLKGVGKDYRFFSLQDVHLEHSLREHRRVHRRERRGQVHDHPHPDGPHPSGSRRGARARTFDAGRAGRRQMGRGLRLGRHAALRQSHAGMAYAVHPQDLSEVGRTVRTTAAQAIRPAAGTDHQRTVARPAREGDAAPRACSAPPAAGARRADHRTRSRRDGTRSCESSRK